MKKITFNPRGEKIMIKIEMHGVYFITYTYQLWASTASEPAIVSNPLRQGSNETPHDDIYQVRSDFVPTEPVAMNHARIIDLRFCIIRLSNDPGYRIRATVYQGEVDSGHVLGSAEVSGTVSGSVKEEFITLRLTGSD